MGQQHHDSQSPYPYSETHSSPEPEVAQLQSPSVYAHYIPTAGYADDLGLCSTGIAPVEEAWWTHPLASENGCWSAQMYYAGENHSIVPVHSEAPGPLPYESELASWVEQNYGGSSPSSSYTSDESSLESESSGYSVSQDLLSHEQNISYYPAENEHFERTIAQFLREELSKQPIFLCTGCGSISTSYDIYSNYYDPESVATSEMDYGNDVQHLVLPESPFQEQSSESPGEDTEARAQEDSLYYPDSLPTV